MCFENHKRLNISGNTVCEDNRQCRLCGTKKEQYQDLTNGFVQCLKNRDLGHKWYIYPTSDRSPCIHGVLFKYYYFETTQNAKCTVAALEYVPNVVGVQKIAQCARSKAMWLWIAKDVVRGSIVSGHIPSAFSLPTRLNPDHGPTGTSPLLTMPINSCSTSYLTVWCGWRCCPSSLWKFRRSYFWKWKIWRSSNRR